jgi:DNA-binding LacI/PurR family transcriptional regulator
MAQVAESARATPAEVALVLAGDPRVPPEVRQRITAAIDDAGYRPLLDLQTRLRRPLRLAVVFKTYHGDDPEANRFYTPVASAIALACVRSGTEIAQVTMHVDEQYGLLEIPTDLQAGKCDGAFLLGTQLDAKAIEGFRSVGCPIVLVDGYSMGGTVDSVVTDNIAGARAAVEHLIAAGHRDIALIGTEPVSFPSVQDRRTGYTQALE